MPPRSARNMVQPGESVAPSSAVRPGGVRGAVVGGAAGAIVGGVVGDQQSFREGDPGYRRPPHCFDERVPVYDHWGNFRGYQWRRVCR